jgi:hypothetical protein
MLPSFARQNCSGISAANDGPSTINIYAKGSATRT